MNIAEFTTSPELKLRAIHKEMGTTVYFTLEDIFQDDVGACVPCNEDFHLLLSECHVDLWTGYEDKDEQDVYGRDIFEHNEGGKTIYGIVHFLYGSWWVHTTDRYDLDLDQFTTKSSGTRLPKSVLVGTLHQFDKLPPKVREFLK